MRSANCQTDGGARQSLDTYHLEQILLFSHQQEHLMVYSNTHAQLPCG